MRTSTIWSSLLTIGLLAVAAGAITGWSTLSYFTDVEISSNNTFDAGTLDLKLNSTDGINSTWIMWNMKPGDTNSSTLILKNNGSLAMGTVNFTGTVVDTELGKTEPECVNESGIWSEGACSGQTNVYDISNVTNITSFKWDGSEQISNVTGSLSVLCNPRGDNATLWLWELNGCTYTLPSGLSAWASKPLFIDFTFISTAANKYQGDRANLTMTFNAYQVGYA